MKYGLVIWKETDNIGDDIQAYATKRFLPKIDYYIDRENVEEFIPNQKEEVATIMNGWYMHNKENFPPSDYIVPLLISMYFSTGDNWTLDKSLYLQKYAKEYLNKYGPVGARDSATLERLRELGIDSYFSGCMTLTIPKFKDVEKQDYICSVDLSVEENDKLRDYYKSRDIDQEIIYTAQAVDPIKNSRLTYEQRFLNIEYLLKKYQASKGVITTRLHCALPCLALGIPVILLYDENSFDRLYAFKDLLTMYTREEFLKNIDNLDFYINEDKVNEIKSGLEKTCTDFIKKMDKKVDNKNLLDVDEYKKIKRLDYIRWKKDILRIEINDCKKDLDWYRYEQKNNINTIEELNSEIKRLNELKNEYENKYNEILNKKNSSYLEKMKQILKK